MNYINNTQIHCFIAVTQLHKINHKKNIRKYKSIKVKEYKNNNLLKINYKDIIFFVFSLFVFDKFVILQLNDKI